MSAYSLAEIDANLLVTLHVLIEERSVSRAAEKMGLSQPAMSHALRRLRNVFQDELLIRKGRGMQPTPKAEQIAEQLSTAVRALDDVVSVVRESPQDAVPRSYRILASEHGELTAVQPSLRWLVGGGKSPMVSVSRPYPGFDWAQEIRDGRADFAVGAFVDQQPGLKVLNLPADPVCLLVPTAHHLRTIADVTSGEVLQYVQVSAVQPAQIAALRVAVAEQGSTLRCVFTCPSYLSAARAVHQFGVVCVMPWSLALHFSAVFSVRPVELSGDAFDTHLAIAWSESQPPIGADWYASLLERGARHQIQ